MSVDALVEAALQSDVVKLNKLLDAEVDINGFNNRGITALTSACQWDHEATVRLLLSRKANVNVATVDGTTALMNACRFGHLHIVEMLLRSGADHSRQNMRGRTVLMDSCRNGHLAIVELLLKSGADHSIQDGNGETALHRACSWRNAQMAELLLRHEASHTCRNKDGKMPLDMCEDITFRAKMQALIDSLSGTDSSTSALSSSESQLTPIPPSQGLTDLDSAAFERAVHKAITMKEKCWNRSKVMLVGQGRAGKSSLARVILGHDFNAVSPSTRGMDKFELNVSTGLVENTVDGSQFHWQEYSKDGSHLNIALASMAHHMAQQAVARADEVESVDTGAAAVYELPQMDSNIHSSTSDSNFTTTEAERQVLPLPNLNFDISLIGKTRVVKDSDLLISLFDFGGQEIFNCVHPFFLTENGAYVVVFDMMECLSPIAQQECLRVLIFWVNSIAMHTKRWEITSDGMTISDIYIVGTHRDQVEDKNQWSAIGELLVRTLSASVAWPFIIKDEGYVFFPVDCKRGLRDPVARKLMQIVESRLKESPFVLEKRPLTWFSVLDDLEVAAQMRPMVLLNEVEDIASTYSINNEELVSLLRFLREMGVLLWYEESSLRDAVILDPVTQFIAPATRIICDPSLHSHEVHFACRNKFSHDIYQMFRNSGVVELGLLEFILSFSGQNAAHLVQMMQLYGLLVKWQPVQLKTESFEGEVKYLVPSMFAGGETSVIPNVSSFMDGLSLEIKIPHECRLNWDGGRTFFLVFSLDSSLRGRSLTLSDLQQQCFLPSGIFEQLMCKALVWCQNTPDTLLCNCTLHKRMVEMCFGNVRFRMTLRSRHNCVQVDVQGLGQEALAVLARLTKLVMDVISLTGCSLHMESFVPATAGNTELFVPTHSNVVGAPTSQKLFRSSSFDWTGCRTHDYVFDVFLSYRWNKLDTALVLNIFEYLQDYVIAGKGVAVFCDRAEFQEGDAIRPYIFKSLVHTTVVAPIVSSAALERMLNHDATKIDNLLFEWMTSVLLIRLRSVLPEKISLEKIMPTLVPDNPNDSIFASVIPCMVKVHPTATVQAVLSSFEEARIDLTSSLRNYASSITVDQIVTDMLGSIFAEGDDINDNCLPCRVAARAVNTIRKTDAFAWSQLDLMSLLSGRLEKYRCAFDENEVTTELLRMCNLNDPQSLSQDLNVSMNVLDARLFLNNLKKSLGLGRM